MKEKIEFLEQMKKVLETSFPNMTEEKMKMMLDYAAWHAEMESLGSLNTEVFGKIRSSTTLPESLKVMFNLNLQNKRVILSTEAETVDFPVKFKIPDEAIEYPFNVDEMMLSKTLEKVVEEINDRLEGKSGIKLSFIISQIQTMREANISDVQIVVRSKYTIID